MIIELWTGQGEMGDENGNDVEDASRY